MLVICGGALAVGLAGSLAIPFAPFAAALVLATALGAGWAGLHGAGLGQVLLSALALLASTQVGYGLGLLAAAGVEGARQRRSGAVAKPLPSALPDLHLREKP